MEPANPNEIILQPNFLVFKWIPARHVHEVIYDNPQASIIEINDFIDVSGDQDAYYAVYQKEYVGDEYRIVAIIAGKNLSETTKIVGYTAFPLAKQIDGVWWFR